MMVYLTKEERKKFVEVSKRQQQEIWNKSKKTRYKRTWYYTPTPTKRLSEWWKINRRWVEFLVSLVIGIILYYLAVVE